MGDKSSLDDHCLVPRAARQAHVEVLRKVLLNQVKGSTYCTRPQVKKWSPRSYHSGRTFEGRSEFIFIPRRSLHFRPECYDHTHGSPVYMTPAYKVYGTRYEGFDPIFFVPMFSGWHKSKNANYGTRLWPFFHSYAVGYGSHVPSFLLPFMRILAGFAPKSELWQQVLPNSHRYVRLWSPCGAFAWAVHVKVLTRNDGNRYAHQMGQVLSLIHI